jgi:glycosyltransferase involved in cell wall biosynthesis
VGDYSYNLFNGLKKENLNIEVLFRKADNDRLPDSYFSVSESWGFTSLTSVLNYVRQKRPKWILLQYVPYSFSTIGIPIQLVFYLLIFRCLGIKVHTNFHEISIRLWDGSFLGCIRAIGQRVTAYLIALLSNSLQTSNKFYSSLLYPFIPKTLPIPSNFEFIDKPKYVQAKSNLKEDWVILSNANRCHSFFFEVISKLLEHNATLQLVIIGRATPVDLVFIKSQLTLLKLNNRSRLLVNLSAEDYINEFNKGHIYFQLEPVDSKGRGGVSAKSGALATALMIGLPTITTKGDLTDNELFIDKKNILFVPLLNTQLLIETVNHLINNSEIYSAIRMNSKSLYISNFAWDKSTAVIKSIITN